MNRTYHGWIVVESGGSGFKDYFSAEYTDKGGNRVKVSHDKNGDSWRDPVPAIEFWDQKVGQPVKLEKTPLGAYRVYTEESHA